MAKQRHDEPVTSSRNTLIVLVIGGLLVAGLVGWALTRSVTPERSVMEDVPSAPPATTTPPIETTATTTTRPSEHDQDPEKASVERVAVEDLHELQKADAVTVIDVRAADAFANGHIPGALNMPYASIESYLDMIPKGKPIVTVCT